MAQLTQRWLFSIWLAKLTGMDPKVVYAWTLAENTDQSVGRRPYNWLNLTTTSGATKGWSGVPIVNKDHGMGSLLFPGFKNLKDGVTETAYWINHMGNYAPIRASVNQGAYAQLQAISATPWNPGGYQNLSRIYAAVAKTDVPKVDFNSITKLAPSIGLSGGKSVVDSIAGGAGKVVTAPVDAAKKVADSVGSAIGDGFKYVAMKAIDGLSIFGGLLVILLGLALIGADIGLEVGRAGRPVQAVRSRIPQSARLQEKRAYREGERQARVANARRAGRRGQGTETERAVNENRRREHEREIRIQRGKEKAGDVPF